MRPIRVLTWHVHGNYLLYLSRADVEFYLPVKEGAPEGYGGRGSSFPFPDRVREVPAHAVREMDFDCVLFQTRRNYEVDQLEILSDRQRRLPRIYLEHDPPRAHPTDTRHWFDDPDSLLVHVTPFNALMWDSGRTPTRVIEHGVFVPEGVRYSGEIRRGIVVINHLRSARPAAGVRCLRPGARTRSRSTWWGWTPSRSAGIGEVQPMELPAFEARYRFFFNPIRWTSLGLAVIEAMMLGMPIVGLATTEMATAIENGVSGYVDTDVGRLVERDERRCSTTRPRHAGWAKAARRRALERFRIERFARDWEETFSLVTGARTGRARVAPGLTSGVGAA